MSDDRVTLTDLGQVSTDELDRLLAGLSQGSIDPTSSVAQLRRAGLLLHAETVHAWLAVAVGVFGTTLALVAALRLVRGERDQAGRVASAAELILTGPGLETAEARETRVVVRELFEAARRSVLIAGYVFHGSDRIFEPLARRMARKAALRVRLVVNVPAGKGRPASEVVRDFARDYLERSWPFEPRPEIYYDPRSPGPSRPGHGIVHAKLIVVDEEVVYIGSANFTTAAFERNIEAGIRIRSSVLGKRASEQFDRWIRRGDLVPLPLPGGCE